MMPIMDDSGDEELEIQMEIDHQGIPTKKQKTKENEEIENMFYRDDKFFREVLKVDKDSMTDDQYVDWQIKVMKQFFNLDRGASDSKKANLGDIKSTKIESPYILSYPLFDPKMKESDKSKTMVTGNIKAIVPIMREKYTLEYEESGTGITREKYRKTNEDSI